MDPQSQNLDRKKMLQVLIPAVAVAGVVLLIGVLIATGDSGSSATGKGKEAGPRRAAAFDDSGMTDTLPPVDAPEWKPIAGGIKVWDVKEGEGDPCPPGATVTIHYTGWTLAGKVFDSSRRSLNPRGGGGPPATFPLDTLIKGWQEGIPGMKPGGVRRLYIPSDLAYGKPGHPPDIPPNADLVFEVKLLEWKK